jgi:HlyD family secretion protein
MNSTTIKLTVIAVIIVLSAFLGWQWWQNQQNSMPAYIVYGNGRIEADQVDVTTKYGGRIEDVFAQEGDLVNIGQVLVIMDTDELDAGRAKNEAELAQTRAMVNEAQALLLQRKSQLTLATRELERVLPLVETGAMSQSTADQRQNSHSSALAELSAANAHLNTQLQSVEAARAAVQFTQTQIDDSTLKSSVMGRVLYRLAHPEEVVGNGGKVLTLLDLADVYMEVFLPSAQAHHVAIGAPARIKLDILDFAIPATVSFVSPESQFTPKQVETHSERNKLMFRVKVRIPKALVLNHIEEVKTGVRGVAYIRIPTLPADAPSPWPEFLQKLPPDFNQSNVTSN